jgi:hypothetical protein
VQVISIEFSRNGHRPVICRTVHSNFFLGKEVGTPTGGCSYIEGVGFTLGERKKWALRVQIGNTKQRPESHLYLGGWGYGGVLIPGAREHFVLSLVKRCLGVTVHSSGN